MALILEGLQFCKELTATEGDMTPGSPTASLTLDGPPNGFESIIAKVGNGNESLFFLRHGYAWMRFRGTVTNPDQLSVDEVLNSSDGGNPLVLGPGTKQVYYGVDEHVIEETVADLAGIVLLATAEANNHAAIDFTDIDGSYDSYLITISDLQPATNNTSVLLRVSQSSSFLSGSGHYGHTRNGSTDGSAGQLGAASDTAMTMASGLSNTKSFSGDVRFFRPDGTARHKLFTWAATLEGSGSTITSVDGAGVFLANTNAIDGVRILMSSGNIATGRFKLFGLGRTA